MQGTWSTPARTCGPSLASCGCNRGGHSEASGGRCDGESATEPRPVTVAGGGKEVRGDVTAFSHAVRRLEWE